MKKPNAKRAAERGPSAASLAAMPEVDFTTGIVGQGPDGYRAVVAYARAKRGRPKKGEKAVGTTTKSVRLTDAEWSLLKKRAEREHISVHALLRQAVAELLRKAG
jgi:hypothetical protein